MHKLRLFIVIAIFALVLQSQSVLADATFRLTDGVINDNSATITVQVVNYEPIAGIQFDLSDAGNYFTVDTVRIIGRAGDWKARYNELDDGSVRVLAFVDTDISTHASVVDSGQGALLAVDFSKSEEVPGDSVAVSFSDIVVSDSTGNSIEASGEGGSLQTPTGIVGAGEGIPKQFELKQNYPNPFNPRTTIAFGLPKTSDAKLTIFNLLGQEVRTMIFRNLSPGYHTVEWNGINDKGYRVESGIYFYQLKAGDFMQTRKMVMLK